LRQVITPKHDFVHSDCCKRAGNLGQKHHRAHTGCLDQHTSRDLLFIGNGHGVQAYDVHRNADVFYKDLSEGVACLCVGICGQHAKPLLYIGAAMSITGIDLAGKEQFWTVTSEVISTLALADVDCDGHLELLAGAKSFDVHVYKDVRFFASLGVLHAELLACSPLHRWSS
jgi:Ciliary BBSome complex subunit 2, N-terminal